MNSSFTFAKTPNAYASAMSINLYDSIRTLSEINNPTNADAYPWISPDGLRLYYTSGLNSNQVMYTQRPNAASYFVTPTIVPISISSPSSYWFSADELDVYICTTNELYFAHRSSVSSSFNTPVLINLTGATFSFVKEASLNATQDVLFICLFSSSSSIAEFSRTSATSFSFVRNLPIPAGYITSPGQISKDALTIFYGGKNTLGKSSIFQLTRPTVADTFAISTFQQVQGINDTTILSNGQASMSDNLHYVAFVRNDAPTWAANDLFIGHNGAVTSIFEPVGKEMSISFFPNPSSGKFNFQMESIKGNKLDGIFEIYNVVGEMLLHQPISNEIDISNCPDGIYFVKVYSGTKVYNTKIVVQR
jgi:hypothetical protein